MYFSDSHIEQTRYFEIYTICMPFGSHIVPKELTVVRACIFVWMAPAVIKSMILPLQMPCFTNWATQAHTHKLWYSMLMCLSLRSHSPTDRFITRSYPPQRKLPSASHRNEWHTFVHWHTAQHANVITPKLSQGNASLRSQRTPYELQDWGCHLSSERGWKRKRSLVPSEV